MIIIIIITRVKMYVYFGFSVARLRRARTINLIVSRSLSVELFCFAACVRHCAQPSRVRPIPGQLARKSDRKSPQKSIENRSPETPRGTQNRLKIAPRTLSGHIVASKSVPKASRERLGSVLGRPRRAPGAPKESLRAPRNVRKGALEHSGAHWDDQNRRQVASGSGKIEFFLRGAFAKHRRSDFSSIFFDFWFFCKVCEPLKVLRLPAKTEVRPFALRVKSLTRCNLEKPLKSVPRSTRNRRKSHLGASRAPFSVDFGRSKQLGRATRSDSGRFE